MRSALLALLVGCSTSAHVRTDSSVDSSTADAAHDAAVNDAAVNDAAVNDAAVNDAAVNDAAVDDAAVDDAGRTIPCDFNVDCPADMRCFHTGNEENDDHCVVGARGTGRAGFDTCDETMGGADCASSLCVSGAPDGMSYCTDRCPATEICPGTILTRCVGVINLCLPPSN